MNRIAVLDRGYTDYRHEEATLRALGYALDLYEGVADDRDAKMHFASRATGIFVRGTIIDKAFLSGCPRLRAIVRYGAGYDNVDLDAAKTAGVRVANVGGYGNHSVSDHALSLIYAGVRGLFQASVGIGEPFGKAPFHRMFELHRKKLGIIGLGRIGGTLAGKAGGLFEQVMATDPYIAVSRFSELGVVQASFEEVLRHCHVISIHCNLTPETRHLLDASTFALMGQQPIIVNTARGPVIETGALLEALDQGLVQSAGLDVFESELPAEIDQRLLTHPKIISTGHYAWYSEHSLDELQRRAAENMIALLQNRRIEDALTY
jgi:D-3-phosphoglycerate dehydrogenase